MRYIIFSYGRPTNQITLKNLPPEVLREVELFVVPQEFESYSNQWYSSKVKAIKVWPPYVDCIMKKFHLLHSKVDDDYLKFDDDLSFSVWNSSQDKFLNGKDNQLKLAKNFLDEVPRLFTKHKAVALPMRLFADQYVRSSKSLIKPNHMGYVVAGFAKGTTSHLKPNTFAIVDLDSTLAHYKKYRDAVAYYGIAFQQSSSKALIGSGASAYRTYDLQIASALRLAELYPGVVTGFKRNDQPNGGGFSVKKNLRGFDSPRPPVDLAELAKASGYKSVPRLDFDLKTSRDDYSKYILSHKF